jgi:multidrug efflux pump subunit AcrA (membrane-fusion protein)
MEKFACRFQPAGSPTTVQTVAARVVESQQQQVPLNLSSTGTVHARETAVVSAQVMDRIEQILVREGDSVRAGQALAVLDDTSLRAAAH